MNKLIGIALLGMLSLPAHAICLKEAGHTYGSELDAADHVYVAMLTQATLAEDPAAVVSLQVEVPRRSRPVYLIDYSYAVIATLKGDPSAVGKLQSQALFDAPDGRTVHMAESIEWQPGDVVLVVATASGPAMLGFCGASKPFEEAMRILDSEGRHDLDAFRKPRIATAASALVSLPELVKKGPTIEPLQPLERQYQEEMQGALVRALAPAWLSPNRSCSLKLTQLPGGEISTVEFLQCQRTPEEQATLRWQLMSAQMPYRGYERVFLRQLTVDVSPAK